MTNNIIFTLVVGLVGWLAGWVPNWHYARRGSKELQEEAARLRKLNNIIISALENNRLAKVQRDQNGEPVALVLEIRVQDGLTVKAELGTVEVKTTNTPRS
jgi:hypothetical protein